MKRSLIALSSIAVLSYSAMAGNGEKATAAAKPPGTTTPKINKGKCPLCFSNEQKAEVNAKRDNNAITPKPRKTKADKIR